MTRTENIRKALGASKDPDVRLDFVAGWDVEIGTDATGDDAVWVWVVLRDDRIEEAWVESNRDALRDHVRSTVRRVVAAQPFQVYVRFRSESEHKGVVGAGWIG